MNVGDIARSWDAQYAAGRYVGEEPLAFVTDIVGAAHSAGLATAEGLYIGCGNGRNYLPLRKAGLDLVGLDISAAAIAQLTAAAPTVRHRLVHGDINALPAERDWPIVIGIQAFQHGNRASTHAHIRAAQQRLRRGGLFCLRVNAVETDMWPAHEVTEHGDSGDITVRYSAGPKRGLEIHFFTKAELEQLFADQHTAVLTPRLHGTPRVPPAPGQWSQWEAIYRRD